MFPIEGVDQAAPPRWARLTGWPGAMVAGWPAKLVGLPPYDTAKKPVSWTVEQGARHMLAWIVSQHRRPVLSGCWK